MKKYISTVYPFSKEFLPFIMPWYGELFKNIEIRYLVSPSGYGMNAKDAGELDSRSNTGYIVSSDFEESILQSNSLFVPPNKYSSDLEADIENKAINSAQSGKHIIWADPPNTEKIKETCSKNKVDFIQAFERKNNGLKKERIINRTLYRPNASVIFVGALIEGCNSIDVTIGLHSYFINKGFRSVAFVDSQTAAFCDLYDSKMLFDVRSDNPIRGINRTLQNIDESILPDVIIIQIPSGMALYNNYITNEFGLYAYMLSQAVHPDAFALCTPYKLMDDEMFSELSTLFRYRFGYTIDSVHMSNIVHETTRLAGFGTFDELNVNVVEVEEYIKKNLTQNPVFMALTQDGNESLGNFLEQKLRSYAEVSSI